MGNCQYRIPAPADSRLNDLMLTQNVLRYGKEEPLPERTKLRAGPLTMIYEVGDLRYIKLGDREVLRRVYVAVRDRNWGTVSPGLSNIQMDIASDSFRITHDVENKQGEIDFFWQGMITGDAQGTITFTMEGVARSTFLRNRIGFCVLHPVRECAGQPCTIKKVNGAVEKGTFPKTISPHQPFMDMRAISHQVLPGVRAEVRLTGDVFEMEDQRNWTDASYKTYCTPLVLPFPVEIEKGTRISQSVTLTLIHAEDIPAMEAEPRDAGITFSVGRSPAGPIPRIGLGVASHGQPLTQKELARLKALNLSHLRVGLNLAEPGHGSVLRRATAEANALGVPLEIALHLSDSAAKELEALAGALEQVRPAVCTWLIFHIAETSTAERWVNLARKYLTSYAPEARIGGGTNAYFTELNRGRPPVAALDLVSYSLNPQVHAFDNASLVETLETQAVTVESARQFTGGLPLVITPITLKPRFNPNVTSSEPEPMAGELPSQVDVRQMSLFGATWTAGSLKYVSESGVCSVTYYETSGWRGVMETETGSPQPDKFRSLPGSVFPLYHVLADAGEFAGGEVVPTTSNDTLRVDGLALRKDGKTRVILANLSPEPQRATVRNLGQWVQVRHLDETNAKEAMQSPERFRASEIQSLQTPDGALELHLLPYAVVRIDSQN
jgi:hypothetical protein